MHDLSTIIHPLQTVSNEEYSGEIQGLYMNINLINRDDRWNDEKTVYEDTDIGWWLRFLAVKHDYPKWQCNHNFRPATKYLRFLHNGKTFFLSALTHQSLLSLALGVLM